MDFTRFGSDAYSLTLHKYSVSFRLFYIFLSFLHKNLYFFVIFYLNSISVYLLDFIIKHAKQVENYLLYS